MPEHMPNGNDYQQASAWMLIIASVVLIVLIAFPSFIFKATGNKIVPTYPRIDKFMNGVLYHQRKFLVLVFVLVFVSALSFFIDP